MELCTTNVVILTKDELKAINQARKTIHLIAVNGLECDYKFFTDKSITISVDDIEALDELLSMFKMDESILDSETKDEIAIIAFDKIMASISYNSSEQSYVYGCPGCSCQDCPLQICHPVGRFNHPLELKRWIVGNIKPKYKHLLAEMKLE